jgi:hypothetical protein
LIAHHPDSHVVRILHSAIVARRGEPNPRQVVPNLFWRRSASVLSLDVIARPLGLGRHPAAPNVPKLGEYKRGTAGYNGARIRRKFALI